MKVYYQCKLRQGETHTTGWIEGRGAKVGLRVELLPDKDLWEVLEVFQPPMPESVLRDHQLMHRGSLPSVEGMGR